MFKNKKNILAVWVLLSVVATCVYLVPLISYGQSTSCDPKTQLCNPIKYNTIQDFFQAVLQIAAQIGSILVVMALIYSGFLFVTARGNEEQLTTAKKALTYTVIGAIVVLGAWSFSVAISNTVNTIG